MAVKPKEVKPKATTFKVPKTLGECADALYNLRQERLAKQKEVDELAKFEAQLKEHVIQTLPKSKAGGVSGKVGKIELGSKVVPQVEDWEAFHKYILKEKDFSLLQRRLGDEAIRERWDNKKTVPGVVPFTIVTVSVKKA